MKIYETSKRTLKDYTLAERVCATVYKQAHKAGLVIWGDYRDKSTRDLTMEFTGADLPQLKAVVAHLEEQIQKAS